MQDPGVHPIQLIGLLALAAATLREWVVGSDVPVGFLQGFLDGLAVGTLYGYLLARRTGRLRPS